MIEIASNDCPPANAFEYLDKLGTAICIRRPLAVEFRQRRIRPPIPPDGCEDSFFTSHRNVGISLREMKSSVADRENYFRLFLYNCRNDLRGAIGSSRCWPQTFRRL